MFGLFQWKTEIASMARFFIVFSLETIIEVFILTEVPTFNVGIIGSGVGTNTYLYV